MKTWISNSDENLEVFIPFLGKYHRPFLGRCCQTCTPRSWDGFYAEDLSTLGFRDISRVTERDTRFRGWLVRRVCGFLASWEWEIPSETPRELPGKICGSRRVQDVASSRAHGCGGDEGSRWHWKEEICRILGEIQAPLSPLLLRSLGLSLGSGVPPNPPQPLGMAACLRAAFQALRRPRGCARVDFSQPFSLQEFVENNLVGPTLRGNRPEQLLLPTILGPVPDAGNVGTLGAGVGTEEEILVTALGLHTLSDSSACSAIMAVGITAALLLHRHREVDKEWGHGWPVTPLLCPQPCQPPERHSLDILDKLVLGGLLEEEEPESECRGCDVAPRPSSRGHSCWDFTDDSDSDSDDRVPKRCYKLSEPQGFPGFLLFLCRLLSPVLRSYGRAVEFLERPPWPQPEADYVEALLEFLDEDEDGYPDRSLALSSLQSFKDMGVLEELQTPTGPLLQLSQPFQSASNREKLRAFIHQFTQL
ncbi:glycerol-3-phosphate acyltransferase 2, mitochondrial-like [Manacus vitellinus]|uniref:glycerol-3-phosphate acyltransferase 2, mitochondrial-like n=1 Tax=Manacus vitellinus TaxID=328815 RepID=UPI00115D39E5|nr:glycerol-3-phosphate acyltransferase 2, mitochondrial-like [Manacus vitellinus]